MYTKILVPLDGSELAEGVLPHVRALAKCTNAEIVLLRVVTSHANEYLAAEPMLLPPQGLNMETLCGEAQVYLQSIENSLRADGLKVSVQVVDGLVPETIVDFGEDIHADLIAMSTHGRSGLARWLIGSVADRVVHGSKSPVLLVRPQSQRS